MNTDIDIFAAIEALIDKKKVEYGRQVLTNLDQSMNIDTDTELRLSKELLALATVSGMLINDAHEDAMQMNNSIDEAVHAALFELNKKDENGFVRKNAKIHAIKAYRRVSGLGLSESLNAIRKLRPDLFPKWD